MRDSSRIAVSLLVVVFLLLFAAPGLIAAELLEEYGEGSRLFEVVEIADKMIVYFHQRMIGDAIVEKDFIVYQFDKYTGDLLERKSHWREGLPDSLPPIMVSSAQSQLMVEGEVQSATLYIISPESDVFPIEPHPENPCWIVYSVEQGNLVITIIDAVSGRFLGNGIPPPYTAFSLTGPQYFYPCDGAWTAWSHNAESWFNTMGYTTEHVVWPTEQKVQGHVQSTETALFYELAHGGSTVFSSGCVGGQDAESTTAAEVISWIMGYERMPFAFIGSCDGMCNTGTGSFSNAFRKGLSENTTTVGYCGMSTTACATCWVYSLNWQDAMFYYMNLGYTVKDAFDQANADYPACAAPSCMRFVGDVDFAIVPVVERVPGPCLIAPNPLHFDTVGVNCFEDLTFGITNKYPDTLSGVVSEPCVPYSIISGGGAYALAQYETLFVTVRFAPTSIGWQTCNIETGSQCMDVYCTGYGHDACQVQPFYLDFGGIEMGDSLDMNFTITNVGCDTLNGSITESCNHYSIVSGGGSYGLPTGQSRIVTVRFEPTDIGTFNCKIETGNAACFDVNCTGISYEPPPACFIQPDTLDLGTVVVGQYKFASFDITNTGYSVLWGTVSLACDHYGITQGLGDYELTHGQTHSVTVIFFPGTEGTHTCTIETGSEVCDDVFCTGVGENPPVCLIEPDSLHFGSVTVSDSIDMDFVIANTGGDTLLGSVGESCGAYSIVSGEGAYALAPDETLLVTVRFAPDSIGPFFCDIETGSGLCEDVFCSGTGEGLPVCSIQPDSLDFGSVMVNDSLDMNLSITNVGSGVLSGSVSDSCSNFVIVSGEGAFNLEAGESLHVVVRFKPRSEGQHECLIETGSGSCSDVYCTGTGKVGTGTGTLSSKSLFLYQNYPNPFNPTTMISFTLPDKMTVNLSIYNLNGKLVKTLVNETLAEGIKRYPWNGRDSRGNPVSSGIYFYRLKAGGKVMTKKMVLLK